eukprot:244949_1
MSRYVGCSGTVTWKIEKNDMVKFLQAKNKEILMGSSFYVADHKFNLYVQPNGCNKNRIGSVDLFLELTSMPANVCASRIKFEMFCYETLTSFKTTITYDQYTSWGWQAFDMRKEECKTKSTIRFKCDVKILEVKYKTEKGILNTYIGNMSHAMHVQLPVVTSFTWNINQQLLDVMSTSKPGKNVHSVTFGNDCWSSYCKPAGGYKSKKSGCVMGIQLLQLPSTVSKIKVQCKLSCEKLNWNTDKTAELSYDRPCFGVTCKAMNKSSFKSFTELDFKITIIIKEIYDQNNQRIPQQDYQSHGVEMDTNSKSYNENDEKMSFLDDNALQPSIKLMENKHVKLSETIKSLSMEQQLNRDNIQSVQDLMQNLNVTLESMQSDILKIKNDIKIIQNKQETDKKILMLKINEMKNSKIEEEIKEDDQKQIIREWLSSVVGLEQYYDIFIKNGYESLEFIKNIESKGELWDIGIKLKGHQTHILAEIKKLNSENDIKSHNIEQPASLLWKCTMCDTMNDINLLICKLCQHQKHKVFNDHIEGAYINDTDK